MYCTLVLHATDMITNNDENVTCTPMLSFLFLGIVKYSKLLVIGKVQLIITRMFVRPRLYVTIIFWCVRYIHYTRLYMHTFPSRTRYYKYTNTTYNTSTWSITVTTVLAVTIRGVYLVLYGVKNIMYVVVSITRHQCSALHVVYIHR